MEINKCNLSVYMLESFHDTQKWLWAVLLSVAIFNAIRGLNEAFVESFGQLELEVVDQSLASILVTSGQFLIVIMLVVRLHSADSRILAFIYRDLPKSILESDHLESLRSYFSRFDYRMTAVDGFARIPQYIVLVYLAINVRNTDYFCLTLVILLVVNSAYYCILLRVIRSVEGRVNVLGQTDLLRIIISEKAASGFPDLSSIREKWMVNNLIFSYALLISYACWLYGLIEIIDLAILVFIFGCVNSYRDFRIGRKIYFPNLWVLVRLDNKEENVVEYYRKNGKI